MLLAVVIGGLVLTGRLELGLGATQSAAPSHPLADEVALPTPLPGQPAAAAPPRPPTAPPPDCEPQGCARWRRPDLVGGNVLVHAATLVHVTRHRLVAVDLASGTTRWEVAQPDPQSLRQPASVTAALLDATVLAIARGPVLRLYDPGTGVEHGATSLAPLYASHLSRHDGALITAGRERVPSAWQVAGIGDDGQPLWRRNVDALLATGRLAGEPLLVRIGSQLVRLHGRDGMTLWSVEVDDATFVTDGNLVAVDATGGRLRWIDPQTGTVLATVTTPPALSVRGQDGLLSVVTEDGLRVYEATGTEVNRTGVVGAATAAVAPVGRTLVVALPRSSRSSGPSVQLWNRSRMASPVVVPIEVDAVGRDVSIEVVDPRTVRVAYDGGRAVAVVDVSTGRQVSARTLADDADGRVWREQGRTFHRDADGVLRIIGTSGTTVVTDAVEVVSTSPLLIQGAGGTLHVDRSAVDG